ncbi:MAG: MarR family winged helix-turn-helix transcriptional regulator [Acidimicrobiales bacterium]
MQTREPYRFGDLLAIARLAWVSAMAAGLGARGYSGYKRTDAGALRLMMRGPLSVGELGASLGISRQAARKTAAGLERRGFALATPDPSDARRTLIALSAAGRRYARAIVEVIDDLNAELAGRVRSEQLIAADVVLRESIVPQYLREMAGRVGPPKEPTSTPVP